MNPADARADSAFIGTVAAGHGPAASAAADSGAPAEGSAAATADGTPAMAAVAVAARDTARVAPPLAPTPEQIGVWGLVGLLYPLLLLVGVRLLRRGTIRVRRWCLRRLEAGLAWLEGAGIRDERRRALRRAGDLALRLGEIGLHAIAIYTASLYFFLLIPGTRDFGLRMAQLLWPPFAQGLLLAWRLLTYVAFAVIVALLTRLATARLRRQFGDRLAAPRSARERERRFALGIAIWALRFLALVVVVAMLPGPGRAIGAVLLAVAAAAGLLAARRSLENVAAGFALGRQQPVDCGVRINVGGTEGEVVAWALAGLRLRRDDGAIVLVPYRLCEQAPLTILPAPGPRSP